MKKIIAILTVFAIFFASVNMVFAEDEHTESIVSAEDKDTNYQILDLCSYKGKIYEIASDGIYEFNEENNKNIKIIDCEENYSSNIFVYKDELYLLQNAKVFKVDLENKKIEPYKSITESNTDNFQVESVINTGDDVAACVNDYEKGMTVYWLFSDAKVSNISNNMIMNYSACNDGSLVFIDFDSSVYKVDKTDCKKIYESTDKNNMNFSSKFLLYNDISNKNYFIENNKIYTIDENLNFSKIQEIGFVPITPAVGKKIVSLSETKIAYLANDYNEEKNNGFKTIVYDLNTDYSKRIIKVFGINETLINKYNSLDGKFLISSGSSNNFVDQYNTAFIANDMKSSSASDVYFLGNVESKDQLARQDYLEDLSSSETLVKNAERYYQYIKDYAYNDNKLMLIPFSVSKNAMQLTYNTKIFEELGFTEQDVPKTYSQFIDFLLDVQNRLQKSDIKIMQDANSFPIKNALTMDIIMSYYSMLKKDNKPISFNDPKIRELIDKIEKADLYLFPTTQELMGSSDGVMESSEGRYLLSYAFNGLEIKEGNKLISLSITDDGEKINPVDITGLVINALSDRKDTAIQFVEDYISQMSEMDKAYCYSDINDAIIDPNTVGWIKSVEKQINKAENDLKDADDKEKKALQEELELSKQEYQQALQYKYLVSKSSLDYYKSQVDTYYANRNNMFKIDNKQQMELIQRYFKGQIDTNKFLNELERILRMSEQEAR